MDKKYIFISGGVCSSLGKGIATASLGSLLEARGIKIAIIKIDPYINVTAGSMNPFQHGEVYVTNDGAETDLDLGNYARFTVAPLDRRNSITTGQIYLDVIEGERSGRYLGETVQVIPHITDCIIGHIQEVGSPEVEIVLIEIGGTVGDIESFPFIEAARQMIQENPGQVLSIHLTLVPQIANDEIKTKPTQHSVKELREIGVQPNILICRVPHILSLELRKKIALFTNVSVKDVISAPNVSETIYEVPLVFHQQHLDSIVLTKFGLPLPAIDISNWEKIVHIHRSSTSEVVIAMVGKYIDHSDSYKSVEESLRHGALASQTRLKLMRIESNRLERSHNCAEIFQGCTAIILPGGFGARGVEGMINTVQYAREHRIPFLGICMGMQIMATEFVRNVLGLENANSIEVEKNCKYPTTMLVAERKGLPLKGDMRLGRESITVERGTLLHEIYHTHEIEERHRHRYEIVLEYVSQFAERGMIVSARSKEGHLVEALEWNEHPWGIGIQFHPEFLSRPQMPHPLFCSFVAQALHIQDNQGNPPHAVPLSTKRNTVDASSM